jgi:ABC-2 type transport system permease protein
MSMGSNAMRESSLESQVIAPTDISVSRRMYWSVRRELWENRSIYIAPLGVAAVTLFGFLIATIGRAVATVDPARRAAVLAEPTSFAALVIMGTTSLVAVFYCLDALHGERRDRSILFWKSLPVSDLTTVLSKASIPLVVLPLLTFAITVATQFLMLLLSSAVLLGSDLSVAKLWTQVSLFQTSLMLLYHLVTVHALWYAPIYGWLLLVSAWARRAAFLWAALPLLAIGVVEKIAFNTSHFAAMLMNRMGGGAEAVTAPGTLPMDPMTHLTPGHFLISPGLWIGLAVTAIFLAAAVRLRRYREPV